MTQEPKSAAPEEAAQGHVNCELITDTLAGRGAGCVCTPGPIRAASATITKPNQTRDASEGSTPSSCGTQLQAGQAGWRGASSTPEGPSAPGRGGPGTGQPAMVTAGQASFWKSSILETTVGRRGLAHGVHLALFLFSSEIHESSGPSLVSTRGLGAGGQRPTPGRGLAPAPTPALFSFPSIKNSAA